MLIADDLLGPLLSDDLGDDNDGDGDDDGDGGGGDGDDLGDDKWW